jgi:hypothetical protein
LATFFFATAIYFVVRILVDKFRPHDILLIIKELVNEKCLLTSIIPRKNS